MREKRLSELEATVKRLVTRQAVLTENDAWAGDAIGTLKQQTEELDEKLYAMRVGLDAENPALKRHSLLRLAPMATCSECELMAKLVADYGYWCRCKHGPGAVSPDREACGHLRLTEVAALKRRVAELEAVEPEGTELLRAKEEIENLSGSRNWWKLRCDNELQRRVEAERLLAIKCKAYDADAEIGRLVRGMKERTALRRFIDGAFGVADHTDEKGWRALGYQAILDAAEALRAIQEKADD